HHIDPSVALRRRISDQFGLATSLNNRGQVLLRTSRYAEALHSTEEAVHLLDEDSETRSRAFYWYVNLGHANMLLGDYTAAERWFRRHLSAAEEAHSAVEQGVAYAHLGSLELRRDNFARARDLLELGFQTYV